MSELTTLSEKTAEILKPKLAIYTTYCGKNANKIFSDMRDSGFPCYFISNNQEVLKLAEQYGWIPLYLLDIEPVDDPIISATQAKIAKVLPHRFPNLSQYDFLFYVSNIS